MPLWVSILLLGIVEGLTEFIPVSSTGHLLIAQMPGALPRQSDMFNVVIQLGAVLALVPLFWERLTAMVFRWREKANFSMLKNLAIALIITVAAYPVMKKLHIKLPETIEPVAWALLIGGVVMLAVERWCKDRVMDDRVTTTVAVIMGVGQIIAMVFPGASRSGSTIMLSMLFCLSRPAATEFTFILGIPTMFGASLVKILEALHSKVPEEHPTSWSMVGLGFVVAAVVSFFVVRWLIRYVKSHTFNGFGIYRIILAIALLVAYKQGLIHDSPP